MKRTAAFLLALLMAGPSLAEVYRWTDGQGRVHYSDQPPPASIKQIKRINTTDSGTSEATANRPPVVLYNGDCGSTCTQAVDYLRQRGVPFALKNASTDQVAAAELKRRTGVLEVPVLFVGESMQRGYVPSVWDKMLDVAGYTDAAKKAGDSGTTSGNTGAAPTGTRTSGNADGPPLPPPAGPN